MVLIAPNNTEEAMSFLRRQHDTNSTAWRGLCQKLQRMARGCPAVYPTALAAAHGTPLSERVPKVSDLRRGMVAFSDDPRDSNPAGHVYAILGWRKGSRRTDPSDCLTWSNDVKGSGQVDVVPLTFYKANWGDSFMFGATMLNNYHFEDFQKAAPAPTPAPEPKLGKNYEDAIELLEKALAYHKRHGHTRLVLALRRDLRRMRRKLAELG